MTRESGPRSTQVKVALSGPDGEVETLWAEDLGGGRYRLDNTPWLAYGISWQDIVTATADADGQLRFEKVVEKSGNRTLRIIADEPFTPEWLENILMLGCTYEGANKRFIGINLPPGIELAAVAAFLSAANVRWEYADPTYEQIHGT